MLYINEVGTEEPPAGQGGTAAGQDGTGAGGGAMSNQTGMQLMHLLLQQQTAMQATITSLVQQRDAERVHVNALHHIVTAGIRRIT